jgi:hypothetical protein
MARRLLSPVLFLIAGPTIAGQVLALTGLMATWSGVADLLLGMVAGVLFLPNLSLSAAALGLLAAPVCAGLAVVLDRRRIAATSSIAAIAATAALGADLAAQLDLHDKLLGNGQFYNPSFQRWQAALAWAVAGGTCAYAHHRIRSKPAQAGQ